MLSLGFLSVIEYESQGLIGGLLLLNANARPLEFHCTSPLKANRAQQILYGPTLEPYLYGEQIGQTLVQRLKSPPQLVLTDTRASLCTRDFIDSPVVLVTTADNRMNEYIGAGVIKAGSYQFTLGGSRDGDASKVQATLDELPRLLDFLEPFGRIRTALEEAQRIPRAA